MPDDGSPARELLDADSALADLCVVVGAYANFAPQFAAWLDACPLDFRPECAAVLREMEVPSLVARAVSATNRIQDAVDRLVRNC